MKSTLCFFLQRAGLLWAQPCDTAKLAGQVVLWSHPR